MELNQCTCKCFSVESDSLYSFCTLPEYLSLPKLFWGFIPFHTGWWKSDVPLQLAITWCLSSQRTFIKSVCRLQRDHSPTTGRQHPLNGAQQHFPTLGPKGRKEGTSVLDWP